MVNLESALYQIGRLDAMSSQDSPVHRLDPRAKVVTTLAFIIALASFGKYELSGLLPLVVYPVVLVSIGNLPPLYFIRKLILAAPFVLFVGLFNPIFDRETLVRVGPVALSGGWVSFFSILLRFVLSVSAALILVAITGFYSMCLALERLRVPRPFVLQLLFLYRYLFVLVGDALRMVRAHSLRAGRPGGMKLRVMGSVAGHLLLRAMDRAHRIHQAMLCRGFNGEIRLLRRLKLRFADVAFVLGWAVFFVVVRLWNLPHALSTLVMGPNV